MAVPWLERELSHREGTGSNACPTEAKMGNYYQTEEEIAAVVAGFEECTTGKDEFTHLSHLTVAVYYLRNSTSDQAFGKMRDGLFRFLDHHGVGRTKYNERLTLTWLTLIQDVLETMAPNLSLLAVTNAVLEQLGDSRLVARGDDKQTHC